MNKQPPNPALARIQALKAKAGSGQGRSVDAIPGTVNSAPPPTILPRGWEHTLIPPAAPHSVPHSEQEQLPPLEDDQDEMRVQERLIALQAAGLGSIAPTNANRYNHLDGQVDRVIDSLKEIDPRKRIVT